MNEGGESLCLDTQKNQRKNQGKNWSGENMRNYEMFSLGSSLQARNPADSDFACSPVVGDGCSS